MTTAIEDMETSKPLCSWLKYKIVRLQLWFLKNIRTWTTYEPAILRLGMHPRCLELRSGRGTYVSDHSSTSHRSKTVGAMKCAWMDEWRKTIRNIHIMEYSSILKRNGILIHSTTSVNLEDICAKWNKPDTQWQILYSSIYMGHLGESKSDRLEIE